MLLTIGIILFALWLLGLLAFHITAWLIHLLFIAAVIFLIVSLVRILRNRNL